MPRRKKVYYEFVQSLVDGGQVEKEAKNIANGIYAKYLEDESRTMEDYYAEAYDSPAKEVEPKAETKQEDQILVNTTTSTIGTMTENEKLNWEKYLEDHPEFICLNKEMAKKHGKIDSEKISKKQEQEILKTVDDKYKIILLQFFKDLLHSEGFFSVNYAPIGEGREDYAGFVCSINWKSGQTTSGVGDCHYNNSTSFTKHYCGPMAENRSFVRAVKSYFNIPLLGADEIGETPKEEVKTEAPTGPHVTLKKAVREKLSITSFEAFKEYLKGQIKKNPENPWIKKNEYGEWANYGDWTDVKKSKIAELVKNIKAL